MKKKLTSLALIILAACAVVFLASSESVTKAQEGESSGDPNGEETECPPEMCYSYATPVDEEGGGLDETLGTCYCGIFYDPDCHYEYVPAFQCIALRHEDGDGYTEEWEGVYYHDYQWGLRKDNSGSSQLDLLCPIPTDNGAGSIKQYSNVGQVSGYFYHADSSSSSSMYLYSAKASDVEYHGSYHDNGSGHRTITVTPIGSNYYAFWYANITVANHTASSFHGLSICYDPD